MWTRFHGLQEIYCVTLEGGRNGDSMNGVEALGYLRSKVLQHGIIMVTHFGECEEYYHK